MRVPRTSQKGLTYTRLLFATDSSANIDNDAVASVTIPSDAYLVAIEHTMRASTTANAESYISEISTSGNFQGDVNDQPDSISILATKSREITQGAYQSSAGSSISGIRIPFAAGERIYCNQSHPASKTLATYCVLHFEQR